MGKIILRLTIGSNALGPFNVYVDSMSNDPIISATTRFDLQAGKEVDLVGSEEGIEYTIYVKEDKESCDSPTISKKVVIYDDETESRENLRIPTTPSATPYLNYDLYLYKKCLSEGTTVERKFFNVKRSFESTNVILYNNECYLRENGPLKVDPKVEYISDGFFETCVECQGSIISEAEKNRQAPPPFYYGVYLRNCCDPTAPTITVNYNFSFWINNSNIGIPSPQWVPPVLGYAISFGDDNHDLSCWTIVKVIPGTFPNAPFVNSSLFKGCKDCRKYFPCVELYKAKSCFEGVIPEEIFVTCESSALHPTAPLGPGNNIFTYTNGHCYYISAETNIQTPANAINVTDILNPYLKCSLCTPPPTFTYVIKNLCCPSTADDQVLQRSGPPGLSLGSAVFLWGNCWIVTFIIEQDYGYPPLNYDLTFDDCDDCLDTMSGGHVICPTASVTPTPTTTPVTPTPTPEPSITPTNSATPTFTPTNSPVNPITCILANCCDSNDTIFKRMLFDPGVSPQIGWVVVIDSICYRITEVNYPFSFGQIIYFPSSVIFMNEDPDTNCENCINQANPVCSSSSFVGCTSGQYFNIPGVSTLFNTLVGNTYIFSNPSIEEVFFNLPTNDLCFTCVQNTGQQEILLIGSVTNAEIVECTDTECVYIPPSPTTTPTPTPTPIRKILQYVECCSFAGPYFGYVDISLNVSINDVININNTSCFIVQEIYMANPPGVFSIDNLTNATLTVYSDSQYDIPCSHCECDIDPNCDNPLSVCSTTPTATPTITPSITPTYSPTPTITKTPTRTAYRVKVLAKSCCNENYTKRFWVPIGSQVGQGFVFEDYYLYVGTQYGACWEIVELNVFGSPLLNTMMDPQYENGCPDCQQNYPESSTCPTPTLTRTPSPTPTFDCGGQCPPQTTPPGDGDGDDGGGSDPCLCPTIYDQLLPYVRFQSSVCCGPKESPFTGATDPDRTSIFFTYDTTNEFSEPFTINSGYFKNLTSIEDWQKTIEFFGQISTYYDSGNHPPYTDIARDFKGGLLPFKPFYDGSAGVTFYENLYHQFQSWMNFFGPVTSYFSFFQQMNDLQEQYQQWGIIEDEGDNLTRNIDPITKNRYGNNLPAGLMRINEQLAGFFSMQNYTQGGDQSNFTLDEGGGQTTQDYGNTTPYIMGFNQGYGWKNNASNAKKLVILITNPEHLNWGMNDNQSPLGTNNSENDPSRIWFQTRFIVEGMKSPYAGYLGNALDPTNIVNSTYGLFDTYVYHQEIIAIGVGEGQDWEHLDELASYPDYVHRIGSLDALSDENFLCEIHKNLCDVSRFGYLYLSGLTTGNIYVFHPLTDFYNHRTQQVQTGPLGIFTIGDIVSGTTYQKLKGEPADYGEFTQIRALSYNNEKVKNWETKYKVVGYNDVYENGIFVYHDWWRGQPIKETFPYEGENLLDKFYSNGDKIVYDFIKLYEFGYDCYSSGCFYDNQDDDIDPPVIPIPSGVDDPEENQIFDGTIKIRIDVAQEILSFASENLILQVATECGERIVEAIENTDEILFDVEYEIFIADNPDLDGLDRIEYHSYFIDNYGGIMETGFHKGIIISNSQGTSSPILGIAELPGFTLELNVGSVNQLLYSELDEVCVHELGHTFGLHHTFLCSGSRWKTLYPELELNSLDNNLPNPRFSECLRCGDYQSYYDETEGAAAYMSYRRFRTYTCGSVRNTLGPIDQNYLEPNRLKYNLNLINTTTTSNDFIFDPQYDQNFMSVAGDDKRPNIIYQKFALDNQFTNSSITNINLSFSLKGSYNDTIADDLSILRVFAVNQNGDSWLAYTNGINSLVNNQAISVNTNLTNSNGGLALFDYNNQEGFGIQFEIERLSPYTPSSWYYIISNLSVTITTTNGVFETKPKDYYHKLSDTLGSQNVRVTDCELNFANKFTSYEGQIIQYYVNNLKNYFDL